MNQMQGGGSKVMSFGKSRAKRMSVDSPKITFKDVAGVDEAVEELQEIKEFLENPKKFQALGARIPKGVLLFGPPGTGKTLLARAVAGEAGVPFFSISGSDFVEMFVGVGASRVRDLFEQAKQNSPCIIFMDEIDAVGRHRGAGMGGGHDEREQTLNQLLVEMDGFEMKDNVILIAATNRPDILDPALLRPGPLRPPGRRRPARPRRPQEDPRGAQPRQADVARRSTSRRWPARRPGFTGADLANLVNEAALLAARKGKKQIENLELEEGIMRVIAGPEKKTRLLSPKEREITAVHEMGHALVGHYLEHNDPVHKISIVGRGMALGYVVTLPSEDKFMRSRAELLDGLAKNLGGRTAEELVFGEVTTGAEDDLNKTTDTAKRMVTRWGMSEKLGPAHVRPRLEPAVPRAATSATRPTTPRRSRARSTTRSAASSRQAHERAREVLTAHIDELQPMSKILIQYETFDAEPVPAAARGRGARGGLRRPGARASRARRAEQPRKEPGRGRAGSACRSPATSPPASRRSRRSRAEPPRITASGRGPSP